MKLLKLSSNNPKFKTLKFEDGLNIVAGLQLTDSDKQTYNGIGKSFSLNLIHLLLGSKLDKNKKNEKQIFDFLAGYGTFNLEFTHSGTYYNIQKNFSENHYKINDKKITQTNFPGELRRILIGDTFNTNVSFKQILNIFARRYGSTYYSDVVTQQGRPTSDYYQIYSNLAMLGVDTDLVEEKAKIKDKLSKLDKAKSVIEEYEALLETTNVKDLKDELNTLIQDRNNFVIAENYDKYKRDADKITNTINQIRNKLHNINKSIIRKRESLEQAKLTEIDLDKVKKIYDEANFFFEDKVSVRLEQATEFHVNLMKGRTKRMGSEIKLLSLEAEKLQSELSIQEVQRDSILKDLDSKGALSEYNSINERIRTIETNVRDLERFQQMLAGFKAEKSQLELENAQIKAKSIKYLTNSKDYFESIENKFRALVKRFYTNHGGYFKVTETVDAKYLFNIDTHVPRDGSQGVNEVKIFCYDFLLHELEPKLLSFIAHDGCIFSEMDPRQKSMIFKVAIDTIKNSDLQYFVNIGQSSLDEVLDANDKLDILSSEEKSYISENIILELYDKNPSTWLFGSSFG